MQQEWINEYSIGENKEKCQIGEIDAEKIMPSITNKEIAGGIGNLKEKAIAWDLGVYWYPKLMIAYSPEELVLMYQMIKKLNQDFSNDIEELHINHEK